MVLPEPRKHKLPENSQKEQAINALKEVITHAGFDPHDLQVALGAILSSKESDLQAQDDEYKFFEERTLIYEDHEAFIFKRPDRGGKWYIRIYDEKKKRVVLRSLRTKDKTAAFTKARLDYIDIKGKIDRGERLKSINTLELLELWDKKYKSQISNIPHEGIVPASYRNKCYFMDNWREYMQELRLSKKPIDKIDPHLTRDFGNWLKLRPRKHNRSTGAKSHDIINNNVTEIRRMYNDLAVRDRYISKDQCPQIDKLKIQRDLGSKRDILDEEQYERFWKYLQFTYITKKHNPQATARELETRKIWKEFIFIMSNVGFRTKELLGMKMSDIMENPNWELEQREKSVLMKVRRENSKTGRARTCVAPVKKRLERIISSYKNLGVFHQPDDYLFLNPKHPDRKHYSHEIMWRRLRNTLIDSGLKAELEIQNKSVSLYSFRHQYASWRLRYGDVPISLLAKQMGTSVTKIMNTYGHIEVEKQADVITKAQEHIKNTGFILDKPEVLDEHETIENPRYLVKEVITHRNVLAKNQDKQHD